MLDMRKSRQKTYLFCRRLLSLKKFVYLQIYASKVFLIFCCEKKAQHTTFQLIILFP